MLPTITIAPSVLLIPYFLGLFVYLLFSAFNLYHLTRFGSRNIGTYLMVFLTLAATIANLTITFFLMSKVGWQSPIDIDLNLQL